MISYALSDEQVPQYAGQTINCTRCGKGFTVPADFSARVGERACPRGPGTTG